MSPVVTGALRQLTSLDAQFLAMEDPRNHARVSALGIYDPPPLREANSLRREAPCVANGCWSRPAPPRTVDAVLPQHGSPTVFTVGIERPGRHGRLGRGATMIRSG